jgi:hypothetical protein
MAFADRYLEEHIAYRIQAHTGQVEDSHCILRKSASSPMAIRQS